MKQSNLKQTNTDNNANSDRSQQKEGKVAKAIEKQTAKLPSDTFLWLALGSVTASITLGLFGKKHGSLFVGQWVPALLIIGLYNKLVKVAGSDQEETSETGVLESGAKDNKEKEMGKLITSPTFATSNV